MSILVDRNTKVITQGMTGETGTFHTRQAVVILHAQPLTIIYTYPV